MTVQCRSCDAEVVFVPSAKTGKPMILDAKPKKGVVVVLPEEHGLLRRDLGMVVLGANPATDPTGEIVAAVVDVYTDHHATCPYAARYR